MQGDLVYRWYLASKLAFADFANPTTAELNANASNAPDGLIWNLTCAVDQDNSQFDLDDPALDESLTFCQVAGDSSVQSRSATVVLGINMAKERWTDGTSVLAADGFNTSTLAQSLLAWRGVDYYVIMSVGKANDVAWAVNDRIKMAEISTDHVVPNMGTGNNVVLVQTPAKRTDLNWNYKVLS